jgi:hypothetical protein
MKPIFSDREFIISMCFLALFGLFGAAVVAMILVGFWLTASNQWAADSAFAFAAVFVLLVSGGGFLFRCTRNFF